MEIELKIDSKYIEPKIVIYTNEKNEEIDALVNFALNKNEKLNVYKNEELYIIKLDEVETIFSENGKVYIKTETDKYISKKRLYELEEILNKNKFIRISNSEIVNFDKVANLSFNIYGTIQINFKSGYKAFASRRNINKIKEFLNI